MHIDSFYWRPISSLQCITSRTARAMRLRVQFTPNDQSNAELQNVLTVTMREENARALEKIPRSRENQIANHRLMRVQSE
jgi:hypothetical protein